ncbi:MAG TPA: DUF3006 domain-containing protein [Pyrinomonadaceae bacterium]|nr:DUF3006 domain-containing protein [Pyrinomonadaceae bacterium]
MAEESEKTGKPKRTRATLDRVEDGGRAVLELGDDGEQVEVPAALLPEGASDGDHLLITVALDKGSRAEAAERIKSLRERLERRGGATPDQKDFKL